MMSKLSVIIPTYNQCELLSETLASVFAQTLLPAEVIVVDDGSTDRTHDTFSADPRLTYIRQSNSGSSVARNTGLAASTGDFILSLDHDDLLHPEYLSRAVDAFQRYPEALIVWLNFGACGQQSGADFLADDTLTCVNRRFADMVNAWRGSRPLALLSPDQAKHLFIHEGPAANSAVVFRRTALAGWNPRLRIIDDWGMILNAVLLQPCPTALVCTPSWKKRVGAHNSSRLGPKLGRAILDWQVLCDEYGHRVPHSAASRYAQFLAGLHLDLGYAHSLDGRLPEALREYASSMASSPSLKPVWWMVRAVARRLIRGRTSVSHAQA